PADIFLFPSVSNALRAVAVTCGLAGQPVAFEDPGYAKARLALSEAGAVIRPLPDDYDGEFRYDVPPLNPLRSMPAAAGHVVYLGTSSKILSRGLRVSWAVLPATFRAAMAAYLDASGEEV